LTQKKKHWYWVGIIGQAEAEQVGLSILQDDNCETTFYRTSSVNTRSVVEADGCRTVRCPDTSWGCLSPYFSFLMMSIEVNDSEIEVVSGRGETL
jgi:hypothetical protein